MFSNRGLGWKLAAALALVAGLAIVSAVRGSTIHPALWRCTAEPARWDGTELWLSGSRVLASDAAGFEIEHLGARARVVPASPVAAGDIVDLTGTFESRGPVVRSTRVQVSPPAAGARLLSEAVSLAVLALILLNFLRHFAFRPRAVQVEGVD